MNVEEIEIRIKEGKEALVKLEAAYEKEEDEGKQTKLEFKISRKEDQINRYIDRQNELLDREASNGVKENSKDKNAEENLEDKDEDVCPECGGDLVLVGKEEETDIYECERCHELFLDE